MNINWIGDCPLPGCFNRPQVTGDVMPSRLLSACAYWDEASTESLLLLFSCEAPTHFQIRHGAAAQNDLPPRKRGNISTDGAALKLTSSTICDHYDHWWGHLVTRGPDFALPSAPEDPSTRRQSAMLTSWTLSRRLWNFGSKWRQATSCIQYIMRCYYDMMILY